MPASHDVAIVGGGAAGLMAAIFASRSGARTIVLDAAPRIGAKILISGGGRCNVTHDVVDPADFNGNRNAIAKVLRTFPEHATIDFFDSIGVTLVREEGGKLFPSTNRARSVLDALLAAASAAEIRTRFRVEDVVTDGDGFRISSQDTAIFARRVVLATGGRSVPKTGSDGSGYLLARSLGHTVTPTFPALVPLLLPRHHWMTELSGTSLDVELALRSGSGRVLHRERGSMLFTHFGVSGPVVLDMSRHWIAASRAGEEPSITANLLPSATFESIDEALIAEAQRNPRATAASVLRGQLPERLAVALVASCGLDAQSLLTRLTRDERRRLARSITELTLPVTGDRGFDYAEVTAGGVPLSEVELTTMQSRIKTGLHLCGEILDVDGKIGGYNFQWAWASGRLAGIGATRSG